MVQYVNIYVKWVLIESFVHFLTGCSHIIIVILINAQF